MASAEYSVLTPERVSLHYEIGGVGSRGAAVAIDTAIQGLTLVLVLTALAAAFAVGGRGILDGLVNEDVGAGLVIAVFALAIFAVTNGYFILFEIVWNGQTPGKRLVGLRALRENGYPLRPIDSVIRNVVRIVDWLPFGYAIGVSAMLLNGRSRRLGDFAAGTIVVREGQRTSGVAASPGGAARNPILPATESAGIAVALRSADSTLIRDFLVRRDAMDPSARAALASRLAGAIANRYALPNDSADPETFLERLV
jgi:uncharacterized RDD family membrane protein YckC